MRRTVHLFIGASVFVILTLSLSHVYPLNFGNLIFGFFAVLVGSVVPDMLEPPVNSRHRGFFHSRRFLKIIMAIFCISIGILILTRLPKIPVTILFSGSCLLLGYIFHLFADALTRRGLPI